MINYLILPVVKNCFSIKRFVIITLFVNVNLLYSQSIIVTSPNGGERWEANSVQAVTWKSTGVANVKIEYSLNGGYSWHIIEKSFDALLEKYSWTVVDAQSPNFLIRISDAANPFLNDISDNEFSVKIPSKNIVSKVTTAQIKLMPLGDSITNGDGDPDGNGYRKSLYQQLINAGYNINFIGSLIGGTPDFDRDHEGHGGWSAYNYPFTCNSLYHSLTTENGCTTQDSFLILNHPDIILLHIGTNDLSQTDPQYYDTPQSLSWQVHLILDKINTFDPNITVFLARIINRNDADSQKTRTTNYNIKLQQMADSLILSGRKIVVVNMEAALTYPDDLSDWGHPNFTGYQKMADAWFDSLQYHYTPVLTSPSNNVTNQAINVTLSWNAPPAANGSTLYQVQISTNPLFTSDIILDDPNVNSTSRATTGLLLYGTKYYWRVRIPDYGWSNIWNFTTEPMQVFAKVFLQGPYNSGSMSTALNPTYLPLSQPYNNSPWSYSGTESVSSIPSGVVDWVLIQLRSTYNGTTVATRAAFLKSNGDIVDLDGTSPVDFIGIFPGDYYIVVKHRNHLAVMSASAVALPNSSAYDFTTSQSQAYTTGPNPMADLGGGKFGMFSGDANADGSPDAFDNNLYWKPANGQPFNYTNGSDYNLDGGVDAFDSNLYWRPNNGKATQVPN